MANINVDTKAFEQAIDEFLSPLVAPFDVEPFPADFPTYLEKGLANCDGKVLQISRGGETQKITESVSGPKYLSDLVLLFKSAYQDEEQHTEGYTVLDVIVNSMHEKALVINNEPFKFKVLTWRFVDKIENIYVWAVRLEAQHRLKR